MIKESDPERYVIPVVRSTFQIITELSHAGVLSLNDAARRTGIPKSTAFRVLATLMFLGVVVRDDEQKTYRLSRMLNDLTRDTGAIETLRRLALPYMLELRNSYGETVNLGILQHDTIVYIEVVPSEYALRLSERPGATVSALSTALGRSILAFSAPGLLQSLTKGRKLHEFTPFTITDPKKLVREVEKIRKQGYAIEMEENALQATCLGVPILNAEGVAVAALSISGPTHRFRPSQDEAVITALVDAAHKIENEFRA